jgi:hypothetical protein
MQYLASPGSSSAFTRYLDKLVDNSYESFFNSFQKEQSKTENASKTESVMIEQNQSSVDLSSTQNLSTSYSSYRINSLGKMLFSCAVNRFY